MEIGDGVGDTSETENQSGVGIATERKYKRPSMYVVLVHNDDVTPRSFVVDLLKRHFNKDEAEATRIMLVAHIYGLGAVSKYPREIAEAKADACVRNARDKGYPLAFSVQEE